MFEVNYRRLETNEKLLKMIKALALFLQNVAAFNISRLYCEG
jgi:hypothetical protein